jgi:archaellum component FlaC
MHAPPRAAKPQARSDPKSRRTDSDTLSAHPLFRREKGSALPFCFKSREVPPPMGKQYAILRVQKCKGAAIGAMQYHNDRELGKHANPDIDQTRTRLNREMRPHVDYEREVQARIDGGYSGERKVRKDAVKLVEGIVTASPEFFERASAEQVRGFFDDAYAFCCEEFGESNMVHFTVHLDEETPHAHFGFVPLRDGKLSWKEFFPNKMALGKMQDRFYGRVGALYGLSRGEKRKDGEPAKRHKSVAEYKAENRRIQAELDEKTEQLESVTAELAVARDDLKTAQDAAKKAKDKVTECEAKLDDFAARFKKIKTELAQIAEVLSWKNLLKRFRDKLVEFSENPICWEALKVGRDFESEKDGKRAERVLERGARKKLKEMNQLEKEMDEWSPFDDIDDDRAVSKRLELERSNLASGRNRDEQAL